jgi:hypothetical protein
MAGKWYGVQVLDQEANWLPCDQPRTRVLRTAKRRFAVAAEERPDGVVRLVSLAGKTWTVTGVLEHVGTVRPSDLVRRAS